MFNQIIRANFKKICTKEDFFKVRYHLAKYGIEKFKAENKAIFQKENPFSRMILGKSSEPFSFLGENKEFILTKDKFENNGKFLLIPNSLEYTNILLFTEKEISLLQRMKDVVVKNLSNKYVLYFHCFPYNSIHTLHLHIVPREVYKHKNNNLLLDDIIYVLSLRNNNILDIVLNYMILKGNFSFADKEILIDKYLNIK